VGFGGFAHGEKERKAGPPLVGCQGERGERRDGLRLE
jgi:hypothetical protein